MDLNELHSVAELRRAGWDAAGVHWRVIDGPTTEKPAAWLRLSTGSHDGQLIVWASGEAEMEYVEAAELCQRHFDLETEEDLINCVAELESALGIL